MDRNVANQNELYAVLFIPDDGNLKIHQYGVQLPRLPDVLAHYVL